MFILYWPGIIIVTIFLYAVVLITLPFNPSASTIALFGLVGFWSRLPGVGMPSPVYILYLTDFVDFFSLIVAVNIGGFEGAMFSVFLNLTSRACGVFPRWMGVFKDTLAQFTVCLIIPYVHAATGGDIFVSMIWYSVLRVLMFFPMRFLPGTTHSFPHFVAEMLGAGVAGIIINGIYARLLGDYFNGLLQSGMQFNMILFLFVTVVILIAKIYFFGHSKSKKMSFSMRLFRRVRKTIKHKKEKQNEPGLRRINQELEDMEDIKKTLGERESGGSP